MDMDIENTDEIETDVYQNHSGNKHSTISNA